MADNNTQNNSIEIKGMAPYLQVYDMPTSIAFYRDKLGFEVVMQSQPEQGDDCDWVLLRLNGIELMLNTIYEKPDRPTVPDATRSIGHADVALFFGCPDVNELYTHLVAKGVYVKMPPHITGYGFKAIYFDDPDGYGIWFHWPAA